MTRHDEQPEEDLELIEEEEVDDGPSRGILGFLVGLVVGAGVAAVVTLLAAPERGEVVRRRIKRRVEDLTDGAKHQIEELSEGAGHELARQRRRIKRRLRRR